MQLFHYDSKDSKSCSEEIAKRLKKPHSGPVFQLFEAEQGSCDIAQAAAGGENCKFQVPRASQY